MSTLSGKYKKYVSGGAIAQTAIGAVGFGTSAAEAIRGEQLNEFGMARPSVGLSIAKGALTGAGAGLAVSPIGAAVGAVVGAGAGLWSGLAQKRKYERLSAQYSRERDRMVREQGAARLASDSTLTQGVLGANYFANGGQLNHLSSTAGEFQGNTHAQGGIQLPAMQAEVEDKETIDDGYVFSAQLGFDKLHRPIAKASGKIEQKAMTPERVTSLNYLRRKTEALKRDQELFKQTHQLS